MTIKTDNVQIGQNATATQNFVLTQNADGTAKLARGNVGATTQDILTIDATGLVTMTQGKQLTLMTAKAYNWNGLTTNTFLDFETIPNWVKRITVMFDNVSTNGTSVPLIQIGDSGGIENTGYTCHAGVIQTSTVGTIDHTTGFGLAHDNAATSVFSGSHTITKLSETVWTATGSARQATNRIAFSAGSKTLTGTLDRVRLTTMNGTDVFDAGSVNVMYEG